MNHLVKDMPEVREEAFDYDGKMMATFHKHKGGYRVAVKGDHRRPAIGVGVPHHAFPKDPELQGDE